MPSSTCSTERGINKRENGGSERRDGAMPRPDRLNVTIPPLEPGDRLTRAEFERRYDAMPNLKKAELIEGVVYMPSPVRLDRHGNPHAHLVGWLVFYEAATP